MTTHPQSEELDPHARQTAQLVSLVRAGVADELETTWMQVIEDEAIGFGDLWPVLDEVASRNDQKTMESLLWLLFTVWAESRGPAAALEAAHQAADLVPDSGALRDEIAGFYRAVHAALPGIDTLAEMTLGKRDLPVAKALAAMERFLVLPPGTYVSDSRRKSPGCVTGVDAGRKVLAVSFGESDRAYDATSVDALEILPGDEFRAMAVFDKPKLQTLSREDPARLVRMVLQTYGPRMGIKDIKLRLADVAVPADGWSKWWSTAKTAVKRDPHVEMSEGTQPDFFLRSRPMTYEEEVRDRFESVAAAAEKMLVVLGYLGEAGHAPAAEAEALAAFAADLARMVGPASRATPGERLAALAVLADIRGQSPIIFGDPAPAADVLGAATADLAGLAASIRADALANRALEFLRQNLADRWPDVFAAAMPAASADVCERIAADLAAAGHSSLLASAAGEIMRRPEQCLSALVWLWKAAGQEKYAEAIGGLSRPSMTVRLFQAANDLALTDVPDKARKQELLNLVRRTFAAKDLAGVRSVLENTDAAWAKEIRTVVSRNAALSDHLRIQVLEVLGHVHPVPIVKNVPPWEEETIYTTQAALVARQKEFEELINIKLPKNSTAIGEAAARGDLSENAEFTAALEERDHLTERANAMQADLVKAKPIPRAMATGETVNIGTTVRARRLSTGQEETLTFLGPWDSDTQKGIYYYKAPLPQAFMGKRVGETVVLKTDSGEEQWEVLEITPAI
ncbi:MAG: GreA/GreB family elongation factor [Planctomycetota bacterium]|nr:GreA/GreB family elongation factor [Planctomycetota bacterium]